MFMSLVDCLYFAAHQSIHSYVPVVLKVGDASITDVLETICNENEKDRPHLPSQ
jgi:hypothetical protein